MADRTSRQVIIKQARCEASIVFKYCIITNHTGTSYQ